MSLVVFTRLGGAAADDRRYSIARLVRSAVLAALAALLMALAVATELSVAP